MWMATGFLFLDRPCNNKECFNDSLKILKICSSINCILFGYNLGYTVPEGGYIGTPSIWTDNTSMETGYSDASDWFFKHYLCAQQFQLYLALLLKELKYGHFLHLHCLRWFNISNSNGWEWEVVG